MKICPKCNSRHHSSYSFCGNCGTKLGKIAEKITTKMYLYGDKESNYGTGEELGLEGEALKNFSYALYEVDFDVEVDTKSGDCRIIKVHGRNLEQES